MASFTHRTPSISGLNRRQIMLAGVAGSVAVLAGGAGPALAAAKPKVGLVMKSLANEFFKQMEAGAEKYAAANVDKFDFTNPVLDEVSLGQLAALAPDVPTFPADGGTKVPAAWLVEKAGFARGYQLGTAAISSKRLALTSRPGGTAADVLALRRDQGGGAGPLRRGPPTRTGTGRHGPVS